MAEVDRSRIRATLIHREIVQLAMLGVVAVAAFFLTRAVAASNHEMNVRDAAEWYRRGGDELTRGDVDAAIDAFRRATVKDRQAKQYVMALARERQDEAARSALLALRESAPEDPEINLELARLAAARQDAAQAIRYYHNALYAPWPVEGGDAPRRQVRLELIRFLLAHDQSSRALSELIVLSTDLPDDPRTQVEVADLFAKAGDSRHALDHFMRALRVEPQNADALAGAGEAAF